MNLKTVVILVGPKGSGKTHLGMQLDQAGALRFLRIEPIFIKVYERGGSNEEGYDAVFDALAGALDTVDHVAFETLAAAAEFPPLLERLREKWSVWLVRLRAPLDLCAERVATRSSAEHIAVSDEKVREYNAIADGVELDWDLELDSSGKMSTCELVQSVANLLKTTRQA